MQCKIAFVGHPVNCMAYDYSCAVLNDFHDHYRDVP